MLGSEYASRLESRRKLIEYWLSNMFGRYWLLGQQEYLMGKTNQKSLSRHRRKRHIQKVIRGTAERPRLSIFRSAKHIYAQVIDDSSGRTIASASTLKEKSGSNKDAAKTVGQAVAKATLDANVTAVVFDRNGFLYHGRVAALAEGAREAGLKF